MPEKKPLLEIITSRTPDPLSTMALTRASSDQPWTIVVPRAHLARDISRRLLERCAPGWVGPRVMTLSSLLEHYGRGLSGEYGLTFLQAVEIMTSILSSTPIPELVLAWPQAADTGIGPSTIERITRFCFNLDTTRVSAQKLLDLAQKEPVEALAERKRVLAGLYGRYTSILKETGFYPSSTRDLLAADAALATAPPEAVERVFILGADGSAANSPVARLVSSLVRAGSVHVAVALVTPGLSASAWERHGNEGLVEILSSLPHKSTDLGDHRTQRPPALDALALDPSAYRDTPVPWDASVQSVRLPTPGSEALWVAQDIRRRLSSVEEALELDDIAIVGRGLGQKTTEVMAALSDQGLEMVASSATPPLASPAVRALLSFFALAAGPQSQAVLIPAARSPYLNLGLSPVALMEAISAGLSPVTLNEWQQALVLSDHGESATYTLLPGVFASFSLYSPANETPAARVDLLRKFIADRGFEEIALTPPALASGALALSRADLDALRSFLETVDEWLRGREIAARALEGVSAIEWHEILSRLASYASIRLSSYSRDAIHVLEPEQAFARHFRVVYIIGMADTAWPAPIQGYTSDWSDTEKSHLFIPSNAEHMARERLLFHLACASATTSLTLTWPAMNSRTEPSVPSPFVSSMPLRLSGSSPQFLSLSDVEPVAARSLEPALAAKSGVLLPWVATVEGRRTARAWSIESTRSKVFLDGLAGAGEFASHAGFIPGAVDSILGPQAVFTPSDLATYDTCHLKFFFSRFISPPKYSRPSVESLLSFVLSDCYESLSRLGLLSSAVTDVPRALSVVPGSVARVISRTSGLSGTEAWKLDSVALVSAASRFLSRDLARRVQSPSRLSTSFVSAGTRLGLPGEPVPVSWNGEEWLLSATVDRVDEIADPRIEASPVLSRLSGLLVVSEYENSSYTPKVQPHYARLLSGSYLDLPLKAYLARTTLGKRVFSLQSLLPFAPADPEPLSVRQVSFRPDARLERHPSLVDMDNPVDTSIDRALESATGIVGSIRKGDFTPQPSRSCFACQYSPYCRSSLEPGSRTARSRPPLPVLASSLTKNET